MIKRYGVNFVYARSRWAPILSEPSEQVSHLSLRKYGITGARPKTIPNTTTDGTFFFFPRVS